MTERIGADSPLGDLDSMRAVRPTAPSRVTPGDCPSNGASHRSDRVDISSGAMQICRAHEAVESAPETRAELVARLQREVAEGTYRVDTRALAQRLLPVLFPDQFGE